MAKVIWTNFAIAELKNIYIYHKLIANKSIADKIKNKIFDSVKNIHKSPFTGAFESNLEELSQGHRYIVTGNYKIIYKLVNKDVYIIDVFDCRQNPQKMKRIDTIS